MSKPYLRLESPELADASGFADKPSFLKLDEARTWKEDYEHWNDGLSLNAQDEVLRDAAC